MTVLQSLTHIGYGVPTPFQSSGGTAPYTYSVLPNGAGGTINTSTGVYTAPLLAQCNPSQAFDTIQAVDSLGAKSTAQIFVCNTLQLVLDIVLNYMGLSSDRGWLWDQKIDEPEDYNLFVVLTEVFNKVFGNSKSSISTDSGLASFQFTNFYSSVQVDLKSRGTAAREQKELLLMAFKSDYSQSQQEANSFKIGTLPTTMVSVSTQDGAAIPYRFSVTIGVTYQVSKQISVPYYDTFSGPTVATN